MIIKNDIQLKVLKNLQIVHIFFYIWEEIVSAFMREWKIKSQKQESIQVFFLLKRLNFLFISKYHDLHAIKQDFFLISINEK